MQAIWLILLVGGVYAMYRFAGRARSNGCQVLVERTMELLNQGVSEVYLVRACNSTQDRFTQGRTPRDIETASLAYLQADGTLRLETPWWDKIHPTLTVQPAQAQGQIRTGRHRILVWHRYETMWIASDDYIVVGCNVVDVASAQRVVTAGVGWRAFKDDAVIAQCTASLAGLLQRHGFQVTADS